MRRRGASRELTSMTAGAGSPRASPDTRSSAGIAACMVKTFRDSILSRMSLYLFLSLSSPLPVRRGGRMPRSAALLAAADSGLCLVVALGTSECSLLPIERSISAALPCT